MVYTTLLQFYDIASNIVYQPSLCQHFDQLKGGQLTTWYVNPSIGYGVLTVFLKLIG